MSFYKKVFLVMSSVFLLGLIYTVRVIIPNKSKAANFTSAAATLTNSRYSYRAGVASGSSGSVTVTIDASGNADNNTNHLFPGDVLCFTDVGENGCIGSATYTVSRIVDATTLILTTALGNNLLTDGYAIASASAALTLTFTTASTIPLNGDLYITVPVLDSATKTNDGLPDTGASVSVMGFDQGKVVAGDITAPAANCTQWGTPVVTSGDASNDLRIQIPKATSTCTAGNALTVVIGSTHNLINPAPLTTHTQGVADTYQINIKSRDSSGNTLDNSDTIVAPVEGVLVSATVDETLALTVAGVSADSGAYCNITRTASSPDTTAYSVPWGTISSTYAVATHNTQQTVTVSTNADAGYSVYIEENDQMGKDGIACTGNGGESVNCIQDTVCGAVVCSESTLKDWGADPSSYVGLGYSLEDTSGTDAVFEWDDSSAVFNAKQIADMAASETRVAIMTNAGQVSGSAINVCFRIDITATQPAGYYYNKVRYTAIPTF